MPRRKPTRSSQNSRHNNNNNNNGPKYSHLNIKSKGDTQFSSNALPNSNTRRGKSQRRLLLGGEFHLGIQESFEHSFGHNNLTLQEEARNTEERAGRRNDDKKLRKLGITFVRSDQVQSTIKNAASSGMPAGSFNFTTNGLGRDLAATNKSTIAMVSSNEDVATTDNIGPIKPIKPKVSDIETTYRSSSSSSSSSEEELVFVPRNQRQQASPKPNLRSLKTKPSDTIPVKKSFENLAKTQSSMKSDSPSAEPADQKSRSKSKYLATGKWAKFQQNLQRSNSHELSECSEYLEDENDALDDYIENLRENASNEEEAFSAIHSLDGQETSVISQSEDGEATPDLQTDIATVIGKREGEFGPEYQFKPAGSIPTEAIWIEGTDMTSDIQNLIECFEMEMLSDQNTSEAPEIDQLDDDKNADQTVVDDEKLARVLQAQEDSLKHLDFDFIGDDDDDDVNESFDDEDLMNMMIGKSNKQGKFPCASKLADAYDGFDIMDRSRASLSGNSKRKSRKTDFNRMSSIAAAGTEDAEVNMEAELERYLEQDREKKRLRKQEREHLRRAGMLMNPTSKAGSIDVRLYKNGMSLKEVHMEIKRFLMSGIAERLALVPMPKFDRSQVHILANKFFMTSKSQGKGNSRFPVLYKTKRTMLFEGDADAIDRVLEIFGTGRGILGPKRGRGSHPQGVGDNSNRNIKNKDGTIVGTGAAELGQGNKGYEMLAKMGWTTGTGLGSNRTGILDPVQAIVKTSRTGLG